MAQDRIGKPVTTVKGAGFFNKLLLTLLAIGVIPLLVIFLVANWQQQSIILESSNSRLLNQSNNTAFTVNSFIEQALSSISIESQTPQLHKFLTNPEQLSNQKWVNETFAFLENTKQQTGIKYSLYDQNGNLLAGKGFKDTELAVQSYFLEASQSRKATLAAPDSNNRAKVFMLISPILQNKQVSGFLTAQYPVSILNNMLQQAQSSNSSGKILLLVNSSFSVVASSNVKSPLLDVHNEGNNLLYQHFNSTNAAVSPFIDGTLTKNGQNIETKFAVSEISIGNDWRVIQAQPTKLFYQPIKRHCYVLISIGLVTFVIVFVLGFISSRRLFRPLQKLHLQAIDIASSERNSPPDIEGGDEVSSLAQSIGYMMSSQEDKRQTALQNELSLKKAQSSARLGSFIWDLNLERIIPSAFSCELLDQQETAFEQQDFLTFFDSQSQQQMLRFANKSEGPPRVAFNGHLGDNQIACAITLERMEDDSGHSKLIGTMQDISEKEKARAELKISEERLSLALQASNSGMWDWNVESDYVYYSPRWFSMLGYTPGELKPSIATFQELLHPEDADEVTSQINELLARERFFIDVEMRMKTKQGEYRWVYSRGAIVDYDLDSRPNRVVGTHTDITSHKQTEQQLTELNEQLESKVEQRTLQLEKANNELIRAKDKSEAANIAKSYFLANMSHEIRTPLNAISGLTNLSLKYSKDPRVKNYLNNISSSSSTLLTIINDILDFSKVEAGKLDIESVAFNLLTLLGDLSDMFAYKAREKNLEFIVHTEPNVPVNLYGDPTRIYQVLTNLVSNAFKFTDQGQIIVSIGVYSASDEQANIQFTVKDTGIGIPLENQVHLFKAFTQADISTTRKYGGTGLGLTICKQLVDLMSGNIKVESTPGSGSEFNFVIPFRLNSEVALEYIKPATLDTNVIVAHESPQLLESLSDMLMSLGYNSISCSNTEEMLQQLSRHHLDFLILSEQFDDNNNNKDLVRKIKESPGKSNLPILIAGYAESMEQGEVQALHSGASNYISLPVTQESLGSTINEINKSEAQQENADEFIEEDSIALEGIKLLLVEDNEINQQVASELLKYHGIEVFIANHGKEALAKLEQTAFDIVLMDIQMPVMDGYTATREIRKQAKYAQLPILAMTANVMKEDKEKCIQAGMNQHLSKPVNETSLIQAVAKWTSEQVNIETNEAMEHEDTAQTNSSEQLQESVIAENPMGTTISPLVDISFGMAQLSNNEPLLHKMYNKFSNDYQNSASQIDSFLMENDLENARQLAHTIKGVSGNLGFKRLQHSSSAFEAGLKEDKILADEKQAFELALKETIQELAQILGNDKPHQPKQTCDTDIKVLMQSMKQSINNNEFIDDQELQKFLDCMSQSVSDDILKQFRHALENFDYDSASSLFADLEGQL